MSRACMSDTASTATRQGWPMSQLELEAHSQVYVGSGPGPDWGWPSGSRWLSSFLRDHGAGRSTYCWGWNDNGHPREA